MNIKRVTALALAGALSFSLLAGCGDKGGNGAGSNGGNGGDDKIKITMILAQRDEWLSELEGAAKANAPANVALTTQDAQSDVGKQLQQIEAARNSGAKAIIVNMVDPETAAEMKEAAGDAKVVFVNRFPADESVLDENAVYVGSDEMTSGKFQGEWLADYFKDQGKTEIKYVLLNGILGQTSTTNRTLSVLKALEDNGIKATEATAALAGKYDRAEAMNLFTPLIGRTDYDCIISNNDGMALGVVEALESKGVDPAEKPIVGIDASKDGRVAIKEGKIAMSVFQDPVGQGKGAIIAALNLVNGDDLAKDSGFEKDSTGFILWVPFEPVTADNVADYDNR